MDFFRAVLEHPFLQYALAAGLLASLACGIVGTYVTARRITYIAGGIAHCVLGGLGAARYCQVVLGWQAFQPIYGALIAALLAAAIIGWVTLRWKEREDTVISALWAVGMAVGLLFIWGTPGYSQNLMSYLFGNILMVTSRELILLMVLDAVVVAVGLLLFKQFMALCFDEEFARLRGIKVELHYLLLLALTAVTVVLLTTVVGLVLVIALLTLPVAIAGRFSRSLTQVMIGATLLSGSFTVAGLFASYQTDMPTGSITILIAGAAYLLVLAASGAYTARRRARALAQASAEQVEPTKD